MKNKIYEVSISDKKMLYEIGQMISKKEVKFSHYASDKIYFITL